MRFKKRIETHFSVSFYIAELDLHHDCNDESRWLCVGGNDRKLKFYDLQNAMPIEVSSSYLKSRITAGAWPIHWTIILPLVDDAYAISETLP